MTKDIVKEKVRGILDSYLEVNNHRKTTERFAILDAVYDMQGHFSLDELGEKMSEESFRVSRATLYNTMRLFIELRLVVRHRFIGQTKYEACYNQRRPYSSDMYRLWSCNGNRININYGSYCGNKVYSFSQRWLFLVYLWCLFTLPSKTLARTKQSKK